LYYFKVFLSVLEAKDWGQTGAGGKAGQQNDGAGAKGLTQTQLTTCACPFGGGQA